MFARLQPFLPTAAIFFLIFYFAFHALTGERGLLSTSQRNADLASQDEGTQEDPRGEDGPGGPRSSITQRQSVG
jgi:cell division protein FtsB